MLVIEGYSRKRGIKGIISYHITQIKNIKYAKLVDVFNEIKEKLKNEFQEFIDELLEQGCNEALLQNMERIKRRYNLSHNFYPDTDKWKFSAKKTMKLLKVGNLLETIVRYGQFAYNIMPTLQFIVKDVPYDTEFVETNYNVENIMERLYRNNKPKSEENKQLIEKLDKEFNQLLQSTADSYDQSHIIRFIVGEDDEFQNLIIRKEIVYYLHHVPLDNLDIAQYAALLSSEYNALHGIFYAFYHNPSFVSYDDIKDAVEIAANNELKRLRMMD